MAGGGDAPPPQHGLHLRGHQPPRHQPRHPAEVSTGQHLLALCVLIHVITSEPWARKPSRVTRMTSTAATGPWAPWTSSPATPPTPAPWRRGTATTTIRSELLAILHNASLVAVHHGLVWPQQLCGLQSVSIPSCITWLSI